MNKYKNIMLLLILIGFKANAQIGTYSKIEDFSLGNNNNTNIIYTEERGDSVILIGRINGVGTHVSINYGGWDVFVAILDSSRNLVYSQTIGGSGDDILECVIKDTSGGFHLFSHSNSRVSGNKSIEMFPLSSYPNTKMDQEIWHVLLDSNLAITAQYSYHPWSMNLGGYTPLPTSVWGEGLTITDVKAVFNPLTNKIIFVFPWGMNWIDVNQGWANSSVCEIDLQGNMTAIAPIQNIDELNGCGPSGNTRHTRLNIKLISNNDIIIYGNYGYDHCYPSNIFNIFKFDQSLTMLSANRLVNFYVPYYMIHGVEELPNGNLLAISTSRALPAGDRTIAGKIGLTPVDNTDLWLCELDNNLGIVNEWAFGTNKGINSQSIIKTKVVDNSLLILSSAYGGGALGIGIDKSESTRGGSDYWLLDIDINTMVINKDKSYGGNDQELVSDLYLSDNYLYYVGTSYSNVLLPDKTTPQINLWSTSYDGWVVKSQICNMKDSLPYLMDLDSFGTGINFQYGKKLCSSESLTMVVANPNPNYTYHWLDSALSNIGVGNSINIPQQTTPYTGTIYHNNYIYATNNITQCPSDKRTIILSIGEYMPEPLLFNTPLPIGCKNDSTLLVADVSVYSNNTFYWYNGNSQTPFDSVNNIYTPLNYNDTNYYLLNTYDSVCQFMIGATCFLKSWCKSADNHIVVYTEIVNEPLIAPTPIICIEDSVTLTTLFDGGINYYKWFNQPLYNDSIWIGNNYNNVVENTDTIYVVGYNNNNCPSVPVPVIVKSNELFPSFTTPTNSIVEGASLYFSNTTQSTYGVASYEWEFEDGLVNQDSSTYHYFYQLGLNDVTLTTTDSLGCTIISYYPDYVDVTSCFCNKQMQGAKVYPTLFTDHLTIEFDIEDSYDIELYSITGKLMYEKRNLVELDNYINNINVNSGTYILKVTGKNGYIGTSKLIKF